ncbi:MAG: hypothetical protein SGJ20_13220, partial [Planctomycetota bacterium]|nr:hypothetical protein [Planctomycetota bacterium]
MANTSQSLAASVSWLQILQSLGVSGVTSDTLPQVLECPVCQHKLFSVHRDFQLGGEWCICSSCNFAGDVIELFARAKQTDIPAAIRTLDSLQLLNHSVDEHRIHAYMRDHVHYRERLVDFWTNAQQSLTNPTTSVHLLMRAFQLDRVDRWRWRETLGPCLGMASREQIENVFASESYKQQERPNREGRLTVRRGSGPGGRRLFHGTGWTDALVIPFFDLPQRPCGFLFLALNSDPAVHDIFWVYKRANLGCTNLPVREAGVALLPLLDNCHPSMTHKVLVVDDFAVALLLQAKWLMDHDNPLPIILAHFSKSPPLVQTLILPDVLRNRKIVFWGTSPGIFRLAKSHGAHISDYRISTTEIKDRLCHHYVDQWLRLIEGKARPWDAVLRDELRRRTLQSAGELLTLTDFTAPELRGFIETSDPDLQKKLRATNPYKVCHQRIKIGNTSIVETPEGWRVERTGEQVCNFALRVEELFTSKQNGSFYRGTATSGESRCSFTVSTEAVDNHGLLPPVRDYLLRQQQALLTFNPRWAKKSLSIAVGFQQPKLIPDADRVGWDDKRNCFTFPQFSIQRGGAVLPEQTPV